MSIKRLTLYAMLLALGLLFHYLMPSLNLGGMKMDFLLAMMFICLLLVESLPEAVSIGMVSGYLAAFTTTFPGGQLSNLIDKSFTAVILYFFLKVLAKYQAKLIVIISLALLGTIISGLIFLGSAYLIVGLPVSFSFLFWTVVIPAALGNTVFVVIFYQAIKQIKPVGFKL